MTKDQRLAALEARFNAMETRIAEIEAKDVSVAWGRTQSRGADAPTVTRIVRGPNSYLGARPGCSVNVPASWIGVDPDVARFSCSIEEWADLEEAKLAPKIESLPEKVIGGVRELVARLQPAAEEQMRRFSGKE